jgi:hypothetical protein
MQPRRHTRSVEEILELLFTAADPARRARHFLAAVRELLDAQAVALCRPLARAEGTAWVRIAAVGDAGGLPTPEQVEAVVADELPPYLPPRRAVLVAGPELALAIDGIDQDGALSVAMDEVEGLLLAYDALASVDGGPPGLDEVPGALGL